MTNTLYLPVETAARELDAKLLLALFVVGKGMPVVLGNRALLNQVIHRFEPGVYLSHNFDHRRHRMLSILARLGHHIVAWDEEGLVWIDPESYRARRAAPASLRHVETVFAWGAAQADALRPVTDSAGVEILTLGNPRADLLGPALRPLYAERTAELRAELGPFILLNSNFGWLNYALGSGDPMNRGDAELDAIARRSRHPVGYIRHKYEIYQAFVAMLPELSRRYRDRTIVIRPHPSEDQTAWTRAAAGLDNVVVRADADLVPWLLATDVLLHNACTTAVESALLGRTAIMYRPQDGGPYEAAQPLAVSLEVRDDAALFAAIDRHDADAPLAPAIKHNLDAIVAGLDDGLAAGRIAAVLKARAEQPAAGSGGGRLLGRLLSGARAAEKSMRRMSARSPSNPDYIAQKFPAMPPATIAARLQTLAGLVGLPVPSVAAVSDRIYRLNPDPDARV